MWGGGCHVSRGSQEELQGGFAIWEALEGAREGAIVAEQRKSWPGLAPASAKTKSLNWALGIT